jgi:hypothetical protein
LRPNEIAIAVPNSASSTALARNVHRTRVAMGRRSLTRGICDLDDVYHQLFAVNRRESMAEREPGRFMAAVLSPEEEIPIAVQPSNST